MTERPLTVAIGPRAGSAPLLEIADVTMRFGGIVALEAVTFSVGEGRIVGLIGATAPARPPCSIA